MAAKAAAYPSSPAQPTETSTANPAATPATTPRSSHVHWWKPTVMALEELTAHDFDCPVTRAELMEAITYHAATAARLPSHFTAKREAIHRVINGLLDELDLTHS